MSMISKELLSEVLGLKKIESISTNLRQIQEGIYGHAKENEIAYLAKNQWYLLNIHELAHKCKEWALKNEFWLKSSVNNITEFCEDEAYCDILDFEHSLDDFYLGGDTEPEAIFKACQWILENKD